MHKHRFLFNFGAPNILAFRCEGCPRMYIIDRIAWYRVMCQGAKLITWQ